MRADRVLFVGLLLVTVAGHRAHAVTCPTGGAKVKVIVKNPTTVTGQQITLSGEVIAGQETCAGAGSSYSQVVNLTQLGDNEFIVPASGGLVTGMFVHHINTNVGGNQHQQSPVLFSSNPTTYATVRWTYHPTVITVNQTGDAGSGTCTFSCTFRQALNTANSLVGAAPAILIQFSLPIPTTLTMAQSADLVVGSATASPIYTVDGTDSNGNPWIVGDALAAAQGNQDPFTRTIDLNNVTQLDVRGDNVTIKGLAIINTVATGNPTKTLISSSRDNVHLEAVRLDGGATAFCDPSNCSNAAKHLIDFSGTGSEIVNVEGRSAYGNGAELDVGSHEVRDSWFHHNYIDNIAANVTTLRRNMLELGGRRLTDNAEVYHFSAGIFTLAVGDIDTQRNVVRNHTAYGLDAVATTVGLALSHDYYCGNYYDGALIRGGGTSTATGTGLTTAYNNDHGIHFDNSIVAGSLTFDNDSAFASNGLCGFKNDSPVTVSANNNQWRGATGTCYAAPDRCLNSPIICDSVQDWVDGPIEIDGSQPTFPSNVILKGQTVRVQGRGFNAIHGNPLSTDPYANCALGSDDVSANNCCRKTAKANVCDKATPPGPLADRGNCVALSNWAGGWAPLAVTTASRRRPSSPSSRAPGRPGPASASETKRCGWARCGATAPRRSTRAGTA